MRLLAIPLPKQLPLLHLPQLPLPPLRAWNFVRSILVFLLLIFFQGFATMGNQMPFLFPHPFMTPPARAGFASHSPGIQTSPIDLTDVSNKRATQECVTDQSKPSKKRRVAKKKPEIVELDDIKDDADLQKNVGHWKDHWMIQLISVRGEMHNTFSQPPKQGTRIFFFLVDFLGGGFGCHCFGALPC